MRVRALVLTALFTLCNCSTGAVPKLSAALPTPTLSPTRTPSPTAETAVPPGTTKATALPAAIASEDFQLALRADAVQAADGAIDLHAELTYAGDAPEVTLYGAAGGVVTFEFSEDNLGLFMRGHPEGSCATYTFRSGETVELPVVKAARFAPEEERAPFYEAWLADPALHLPAGGWSVSAQGWLAMVQPDDCAWDDHPGMEPSLQLFDARHILVTDFTPLAMPANGCSDDFHSTDTAAPLSLTVNSSVEANLTMQFGWAWRDSTGSGDVDYGVWAVDVPAEVVYVEAGGTLAVSAPENVQLFSGDATRYGADSFKVDRGARTRAGAELGHPVVRTTDGSDLEIVAPDARGSWIIQLRVGWLTPCLISDGEINFRLDTR